MKKHFLTPLLFFSLFVYLHLSAQESKYIVSQIPENLKENANSVVLKDDYWVTIKSQEEMNVKADFTVTVLNKLGDKNALIVLNYDNRLTIKNIEVHVYDAFGKELKKIKKSDFKDVSATDDNTLIGDSRYLYYKYIPITYPYTISYSYEIKSQNTAAIPSWWAVTNFNKSVVSSFYSINYPPEFKLQKSQHNFNSYPIEISEDKGVLTYSIKNMPAIDSEPYANANDIFPNVNLGIDHFDLEGENGTATNAKEFGKWVYSNLIKNGLSLPVSTQEKIIALTSVTNDSIEKAKIVYDFVQNKVRYISIQLGIGGYKPMLASEVDNLSYGDCKGLTNYTAALLNIIGIKSYHTLVYSGNNRNIDPNLASPQGNHMILYLPLEHKDIWLECTSQDIAFGEIGDFTDDRDVLVLTPKGGEIKHTKIYKPDENQQKTTGDVTISSTGSIQGTLNRTSKGIQYDDHLMEYTGLTPKELDLTYKNNFPYINNIQFSKIESSQIKNKATYNESLDFKASNYASISGNELLIPVNIFNRNTFVPKRVRNRKLPFKIESGYVDIDEITIHLPLNCTIDYIPENAHIDSKFGNYYFEITKINAYTYNYKRYLKLLDGTYSKDDYDAFRKFKLSIKKYDNSKIITKTSTL